MIEYLEDEGWWWPAYDKRCEKHLAYWKRHEDDMMRALELCQNKRVCIQAGGNMGLWPKKLAEHFDVVYTFEPHPDLYQCLVRNATAENIIKMQAVLGCERGPVAMRFKSIGSHWVLPEEGIYPTIVLDDLNLPHCDAIFLDIEGFEYYALQGAAETIKRCRPLIQIEDKEVEFRHGLPGRMGEKFLLGLGYQRGERVGDDRIYLPCEI